MIRTPKAKSEQNLAAEPGSRQSPDVVQIRRTDNLAFGLEPAEFEALVYRMCSCGILRIEPGSTRPPRGRRCRRRRPLVWCRLGDRGATGIRLVETKFG
jgi:hypothetical protein